MTVSETLAALKTQKGIEPKASYTGTEDTDDFIFAVQTDSSSQTKESAWIVCADHVKEHSGALNRCVGDDFQDFALSHKIKYGTGSDVIVPYIYFSIRTGKGESGSASLIVNSDVGGAANASATFAMDVKAVGTPVEFDYIKANPQSNTDTAKPVKA